MNQYLIDESIWMAEYIHSKGGLGAEQLSSAPKAKGCPQGCLSKRMRWLQYQYTEVKTTVLTLHRNLNSAYPLIY
jgi:hypothetical protein